MYLRTTHNTKTPQSRILMPTTVIVIFRGVAILTILKRDFRENNECVRES